MSFLQYVIIIAGILLSGGIVLFVKIPPKLLKLLLAFSGAFLFAVCVMHLIPEIYSESDRMIGIFILAGFILQVIIEFFSEGIEHGHIHLHKHNEKAFPLTMMIALCIHSFLEGMPLGTRFGGDEETQRSLFLGIVMHNIPISIALCTLLLQSGLNRFSALAWLFVFSLMTPLGSFTADWMGSSMNENLEGYFKYPMALVVGIFLHISTTILFESSENHRFNLIKVLIILLGAAAGILI